MPRLTLLNSTVQSKFISIYFTQNSIELFVKYRLERAVQCIRADFAELSDQNRRDLEEWYRVKVDEMMARLNLRNDATLDASGLATPNSSGPYNKAPTESPNSLRSTLNQSQLEFSEEIKRNKMLLHRLAKLEDELEQTRINNAERLRVIKLDQMKKTD